MNERDDDRASADDDDPNDPSHPDFDLSEVGRPVHHYETGPEKPWFLRRVFLQAVAAVLIASMTIPVLPR